MPQKKADQYLSTLITLTIFYTIFILGSFPVLATDTGETRYVSDKIKIYTRAGAGTEFKLIAPLFTGEEVTLLNEKKNNWIHIEHGRGRRGWIQERFLTSVEPDAKLLLKANTKIKQLEQSKEKIIYRTEINDKQRKHNTDLTLEVKELRKKLNKVEIENKTLQDDSANFLELQNEYKKLLAEKQAHRMGNNKVNQERSNKNPIIKNMGSKSWALIIGISSYQKSDQHNLSDLIFADDDAKEFELTLLNLNWNKSHIKLLTNEKATQRNIMIALESWLSKAGSNDQIILFWSGHGYPDPENPEKVYFACYDTDISIPATGYRMDKVRAALEERKSKNVILFADTCHAGKLITRGIRGISIIPQIDKMTKEQNVPKGWVFMVGADTDREAIEHTSWANGAFTHSLIKGLNGAADGFQSAGMKDGIITMGELKDFMKTSMPDETLNVLGVAKHPVITTSTGDPNIWNMTLQLEQ